MSTLGERFSVVEKGIRNRIDEETVDELVRSISVNKSKIKRQRK